MKILLITLLILPISANAWQGTMRDSGDSVEIATGQNVREGEEIEYSNEDTGETHEAEVLSVNKSIGTTDVAITDNDTGAEDILEME